MLWRALRNPLLVAGVAGAVAGPAALGSAEASSRASRARAGGPGDRLAVMPFPGTPDASTESQIIFSSLTQADLRSVTVTGSSSGRHSGHLSTLPHDAGTAFVPDRPFIPGEHVQVCADLTSPQAGTAAGAPGATRLRFSFHIGLDPDGPAPRVASAARSTGAATTKPSDVDVTRSFRSLPNFHPPTVTVHGAPAPGPGDIFLTANHNSQPGPMILSSRGELLWFRPVRHRGVFNLEVQRYRGRPVLTWWQGHSYFAGEDVITDRSYHAIAVVHGAEGYEPDLHEFQITPQGTALLDAYHRTRVDLSSVGGSKYGTVIDCVVLELDLETGQVLWEWHSLGHVPVSASYYPAPKSGDYDYFHLNSIQQLPGGNLLISGKGTWTVYEISRRTGRIIWRLGGKDSSFTMGPRTNFEWQHDAHMDGHTVSVFDDADSPQEERESSAKLLTLNTGTMTATLTRRFTHSPPALADVAGSVQTLPDRDVFVGWGSEPYFSEFAPGGRLLFSGNEARSLYSYRAYRFRWSGRPKTEPALAVRAHSGRAELYASWNGATDVSAWRVLAGAAGRALHPLGAAARRTGFETAIARRTTLRRFAVQALDSAGRVLGTSPAEVATS
jgi:hypothetical protein